MNNTNKFLLSIVVVAALVAATPIVFAQQEPPQLEKPPATTTTGEATTSLGKIIIQISQLEQIVIDLPLKNDDKYQVIPIK